MGMGLRHIPWTALLTVAQNVGLSLFLSGNLLMFPNSSAFNLVPVNLADGPITTMRITVTISGNTPSTVSDVQDESTRNALAEESTTAPSTNSGIPSDSPDIDADLQTTAEADLHKASENVAEVYSTSGAGLIRQPRNLPLSASSGAVGGLGSALDHLEGLKNLGDIVADVSSVVCAFVVWDSDIDVCSDPSNHQRGVEFS